MKKLLATGLCTLLASSSVKAEELGASVGADPDLSLALTVSRTPAFFEGTFGVVTNVLENPKTGNTGKDIQVMLGAGIRIPIGDFTIRPYGQIQQGISDPIKQEEFNKDLTAFGLGIKYSLTEQLYLDFFAQKNYSRAPGIDDSLAFGIGISYEVEKVK